MCSYAWICTTYTTLKLVEFLEMHVGVYKSHTVGVAPLDETTAARYHPFVKRLAPIRADGQS